MSSWGLLRIDQELEEINRQLRVIAANQRAQGVVLRSVIVISPKSGGESMDPVLITTEQNATITVIPETATGKTTTVDGIPVWSTSNTLLTLTPAADGLSCHVTTPDTLDVPGGQIAIDVLVDADADRGAGVRDITLTFPFILALPEATALVGSVTLETKV